MRKTLSDEALEFLTQRHLATLSTFAKDGSIHAVAVGFTYADGIARVITSGSTQKALNVRRAGQATLCQLEGPRWITLSGPATVLEDADSVADAVERYARRYRTPRVNPERVAISIEVTKLLGSRGMFPDEG